MGVFKYEIINFMIFVAVSTFERIRVKSHFAAIYAKNHSHRMEHFESIVDLIQEKSPTLVKRYESK